MYHNHRCLPYMACSEESQEGFCPHVDTTCSAVNTCRTCNTFSDNGGECVELDYFPNVSLTFLPIEDFSNCSPAREQ